MTLRLHVAQLPGAGDCFALPAGAARHAQVRRSQPGDALRLFDGRGGEWTAEVVRMGRHEVEVRLAEHLDVSREPPFAASIALGVPANERMDALIEKATELGVEVVQPLMTERSVLRVGGERAARRRVHWQAIAVAAAEQCGATRIPELRPVMELGAWLRTLPPAGGELGARWLLSPAKDARPWAPPPPALASWTTLSGPEGGLSEAEQALAAQAGFEAVGLGPRVLRADTAPLAVLAAMLLRR